MHIQVDADKCIGSGACVLACPEVFTQDGDWVVVLLDQSPPNDLHDKVREAARACPASVIETDD